MPREPLKKILVVEDDEDIQEIAKMALSVIGKFEVVICSSGQEALEQVKTFTPQLILLDVMMPVLDGIATLHKLREMPHVANVPVIFMTAKVQPHEIASYKNKGAIDVITKPFNPTMLPKNLVEIWEKNP